MPGYEPRDLAQLLRVQFATLPRLEAMKATSALAVQLAQNILSTTQKGPDQTASINKLRECLFFATQARAYRPDFANAESHAESLDAIATKFADPGERDEDGQIVIDPDEIDLLLVLLGVDEASDDERDDLDSVIEDLSKRHARDDIAHALRERFRHA